MLYVSMPINNNTMFRGTGCQLASAAVCSDCVVNRAAASLRKMLRRVVDAETEEQRNAALDKLQEVIQDVQFANDEGDPGMGLELGRQTRNTIPAARPVLSNTKLTR